MLAGPGCSGSVQEFFIAGTDPTQACVPTGYGAPSLDFFGSALTPGGLGRSFAIEAKRPRKVPTPRQEATMERMQRGGVTVFVINDDIGCALLDAWLEANTR